MGEKNYVTFPIKVPKNLHVLTTIISTLTNKSRHDYYLEAIQERADIDSEKLNIKIEKEGFRES